MSLTFIVKCTRRCNLRCSYCHDWRDSGVRSLSFEHLAKLTQKGFDHADRVQFIWHGGEPLLLGREWFEKALLIQDLAMEEGQAVANQLQTNATLLDEEWIEFFERHNFQLGVSVDGPPEMHDQTRVDIHGEGTSERVHDGLELLKESDVPFGLLMVVTDDVLERDPVELYEWFKSIDAPSVGFLSQRPDTEGLETVRKPSDMSAFLETNGYVEFMTEIFEEWWADDGDGPDVRELSALLNGLVDSSPGLCIYEGSCVGNYFGVNPNGDVYHCDRYIPDPEYKVGNIGDDEFTFLPDHLLEIQEREAQKEADAEASCEWYNVCHGGCPHDRNTDPAGWEARDSCCGMAPLLEKMDEKVQAAMPQ